MQRDFVPLSLVAGQGTNHQGQSTSQPSSISSHKQTNSHSVLPLEAQIHVVFPLSRSYSLPSTGSNDSDDIISPNGRVIPPTTFYVPASSLKLDTTCKYTAVVCLFGWLVVSTNVITILIFCSFAPFLAHLHSLTPSLAPLLAHLHLICTYSSSFAPSFAPILTHLHSLTPSLAPFLLICTL